MTWAFWTDCRPTPRRSTLQPHSVSSHNCAAGERVEKGYQLIRDPFLFTDKRLICVNRQGITGSKVSYLSIPCRTITRFSVETAGTFDLDAELKV